MVSAMKALGHRGVVRLGKVDQRRSAGPVGAVNRIGPPLAVIQQLGGMADYPDTPTLSVYDLDADSVFSFGVSNLYMANEAYRVFRGVGARGDPYFEKWPGVQVLPLLA